MRLTRDDGSERCLSPDRSTEERVSAGGIVFPDSAAEKPVQGKIVAVGKGTQIAQRAQRA